MIVSGQLILVAIFTLITSPFLGLGIVGSLATVFVPVALFFPNDLLNLFLSLLVAFGLSFLLRASSKKHIYLSTILTLCVIFLGLFIYRPSLMKNIVDPGVINAQRGEHTSYQTNLLARLLHNKISNAVFYLENFSEQLSPSVIFTSGHYPNFSKYFPIGYIFPWYIILFLLSLRKNSVKYFTKSFVMIMGLLLLLASISNGLLNWFIVSSVVWFIIIQSATYLNNLNKKISLSVLVLNLLYLFLFILPINLALNSMLFYL